MLPYSVTKRTTIFRTAREGAGPEGREGGDDGEEPRSQLDTGIHWEGVEIGDLFQGRWFMVGGGTSCFDGMGFAAHCVVLAFLATPLSYLGPCKGLFRLSMLGE